MVNSNLFFESTFGRSLSDSGTRDYLVQITNEYPYFAPAQFFLLLLTEKGTAEYKKQAAKTAVFFNNPYWLQFQINEKKWTNGSLTENIVVDNELSPAKEAGDFVTEFRGAAEMPGDHQTDGDLGQSERENAGLDADEATKQSVIQQPNNSDINPVENEEMTNVKDEHMPSLSPQMTDEPIPENNIEPLITGTESAEDIYKNNGNKPTTLEAKAELTENTTLNALQKEEQIAPAGEIQANYNKGESANTRDDTSEDVVDSSSLPQFSNENDYPANKPQPADEIPKEDEIAPLNINLKSDEVGPKQESVAFEPLHTSDYFASIGVKLTGDFSPSDKLGKQLKSFTEWLKTMKRIHNGQQPVQLSGQSDISIQQLAEESNKDNAVVTEAMADVLLQQGKAEKAIEVYKKLSLLNPSKSVYFAAKIDQLKEH